MSNLKNFRIKKVSEINETRYYPQVKRFGLFWVNMFGFLSDWDGGYYSFESAKKELCNHLKNPVIEYYSVNCGEPQ